MSIDPGVISRLFIRDDLFLQSLRSKKLWIKQTLHNAKGIVLAEVGRDFTTSDLSEIIRRETYARHQVYALANHETLVDLSLSNSYDGGRVVAFGSKIQHPDMGNLVGVLDHGLALAPISKTWEPDYRVLLVEV